MGISVQGLFDDTASDISDGASLLGGGGLSVGTINEDGLIRLNFTLSEEFTDDNYKKAGLTDIEFADDISWLPESHMTYMTPSNHALNKSIADVFKPREDGSYKVYGFAQSENGQYYRIQAGSPAIFWLSKPTFKVKNIMTNSFEIHFKNLEQTVSSENYSAYGVTLSPFQEGKTELYHASSGTRLKRIESPITYTGSDRDFNILFYGIPADTEADYYIFKKDFMGCYWLLAHTSVKTLEMDIPECSLDCQYYDEPFSYYDGRVKGKIKNCPHIKAEKWNAFTADINAVRVKAELTEYDSFTNVSTGQEVTAAVFNQAYYAIKEIYDEYETQMGATMPDNFTAAVQRAILNKTILDGLQAAIQILRDYIFI